MEYFDAETLSDIIFDDGTAEEFAMKLENKHQIAEQICEGIAYLHAQEVPILHRDLKPENILVNKAFVTKICDLGCSKFADAVATVRATYTSTSLIGTQLYSAPEILVGDGCYDELSEVWSIACTLLELYSGRIVWNVANDKYLKQKMNSKEISNCDYR